MMLRLLFTILCAALLGTSQETLTNDSIIKMVKAGLSETVILTMVAQQPGNYSTRVDDLIALKQAGVSDKIIAALATKSSSPPATAPLSPKPSDPAAGPSTAQMEIGAYYKKEGAWTEVLPEVVNWKTGGTMKNLATVGVVKKDLNGNINGPTSRNSVKTPLEFLIVTAEGVSITEYQLIRLRLNKNYREFRTVTGGVFNQQSGAMRDIVPFEGKKVSSRTFSVILPNNLGAGEYGFLSPVAVGTGGNTQAQIGKMYTFRIIE